MGRVIAIILMFVAAGFVVNIGVAWSIAAQTHYMDFSPAATAEARRALWDAGGEQHGVWLDKVWTASSITVRFMHQAGDRTKWTVDHEVGWPLRSMRGRVIAPEKSSRPPRFFGAIDLDDDLEMLLSVGGGSQPVFTDSTPKTLPLIPMWPGAAVNSLLFSGILVLAAGLLLVVRTIHRLTRGRCPACAYDLRRKLATGCPECGWRRTRAATDHAVRSHKSESIIGN